MSPRLFRYRVLLLMTVLLLSTLLLAQEPAEGKRYALLVGVQRYSDGTGLRNLDYTEKDVADLAAVLEKQGYRVTILTRAEARRLDQDFLEPSAKNVFDYLKRIAAGSKSRDTVLVAFTGHGAHLKSTDKLYFCPMGTDLKDAKTLVSIEDVMAELDEKKCSATSKVLLVDACRNDPADGKTGASPEELKTSTRPLVPDPPGGTVAMFSCSKGQISHESATHKRGFLFHHVIEGLSGKAASKKTGEVTMLSLANYVGEELPHDVSKEKGPLVHQTPEVRGNMRQMVLARVKRDKGEEQETPESEKGKSAKEIVSKTLPGLKLLRIPAGKFLMGSPKEEKGRDDDETQHEVTLTKDYYMGETHVTVGQWRAFQKATGHDANAGAKPSFTQEDDHPVVNVNWEDAKAFCAWLSREDGRKYRLPTEAEWEYACRAGTKTAYWYGDEADSTKSNFNANLKGTTEVRRHKANGFGLYDAGGNAYQWCENWYDKYKEGTQTNPTGQESGSRRVFRGGGWDMVSKGCRSAFRGGYKSSDRFENLGFRLTLSLGL